MRFDLESILTESVQVPATFVHRDPKVSRNLLHSLPDYEAWITSTANSRSIH